jgi:uncharacterized protein (DUF1800 family)
MRSILTLALVVGCGVVLPAEQSYSEFAKKLSGDQQILHALDRLTFGPRPGDVDAVKKMGLSQWIDLQLHPERIPENEALAKLVERLVEPTQTPLDQLLTRREIRMLRTGTAQEARDFLATLPREKARQVLALMPAVRQKVRAEAVNGAGQAAAAAQRQPGRILAQAKLYRAIENDRQLEEVLADFWFNHFNVDAGKGADRFLISSYDRDAIRPHVLGKFRDLLEATANSPAMMFYLDNWQSTVARPNARQPKQAARGLNENYARELMELHTLGVDGGYTQKDIVEVARCFTGWTIDQPRLGGPFVYNDRMHDKGAKTVLGVTIPAGGGKGDGERVLDILAHQPSTAKFISRELAQRFVADDPPPALVERMAKTFRESDGDIRAVLSTLFASPEFFSQGAYRAKVKTPFEMIVSAVRTTGAQVDDAGLLVSQAAALGQPLYRKQEPTGYSNVGEDWMNSAALLARMNFALRLAQNQMEGVKVNLETFSAVPATAARQLLFADAAQQTLDAIGSEQNPGLIAGMLLGSPDFQRR